MDWQLSSSRLPNTMANLSYGSLCVQPTLLKAYFDCGSRFGTSCKSIESDTKNFGMSQIISNSSCAHHFSSAFYTRLSIVHSNKSVHFVSCHLLLKRRRKLHSWLAKKNDLHHWKSVRKELIGTHTIFSICSQNLQETFTHRSRSSVSQLEKLEFSRLEKNSFFKGPHARFMAFASHNCWPPCIFVKGLWNVRLMPRYVAIGWLYLPTVLYPQRHISDSRL